MMVEVVARYHLNECWHEFFVLNVDGYQNKFLNLAVSRNLFDQRKTTCFNTKLMKAKMNKQ